MSEFESAFVSMFGSEGKRLYTKFVKYLQGNKIEESDLYKFSSRDLINKLKPFFDKEKPIDPFAIIDLVRKAEKNRALINAMKAAVPAIMTRTTTPTSKYIKKAREKAQKNLKGH